MTIGTIDKIDTILIDNESFNTICSNYEKYYIYLHVNNRLYYAK